jgi:hypothetical protein
LAEFGQHLVVVITSRRVLVIVGRSLNKPTRRKAMSESEYYAGEFDDTELDALADAGEFYLDESGFYQMPSQEELKRLVDTGEALLLVDWLTKI